MQQTPSSNARHAHQSRATEPMQSLRTGLRVLLQFERNRRDFSVTEIAIRTGLGKSQVSKILCALVDSGLLVQDPETRSYAVGVRTFALGSRFTSFDGLCQAATPIMRDLLQRTRHSVRLSVPYRDKSLYLIGLEGPLFMDTGWHSGSSVAMAAASAGRVMMAYETPARRAHLLGLAVPQLTPHTVVERTALERLVADAQENGWSIQRHEVVVGLGVISVPLFSGEPQAVGALSLAFPSHSVG
ncbi:MAG: helix-turn-helix domain-containing protein, partial [Rhodoferax sp.]|nr:helix-turn-helix domain-containing protein [Rhodoferax sp.]